MTGESRFDRVAVKRWRRVCHRELDRIGADTAMRAAGLVMMCVYGFGTDVATIAEVSGQAPSTVRAILKRLRQQRVLVGQTLRVNWEDDDYATSLVSVACDLLVVVGDVQRPVDPKRSAALKGKAGRKRGGRNSPKPRTVIASGAAYTPKVRAVPQQLYQISEDR